MGRPRKIHNLETIVPDESGKRHYVTNLGSVNQQALLVEQFFRDDKTISTTLKALVLTGLEATYEERTRLVGIYALVFGCTFEQAWLRIVTGRAERLDFSNLSEEQFKLLDEQLGKQTLYEINKKSK